MITRIVTLIASIGLAASVSAQNYNDYVGAGHNVGMTITASSSEEGSGPEKTMDASGLLSPYFAAGRFLNQATIGANTEDIEELLTVYGGDYEAWIDAQFDEEMTLVANEADDIWQVILDSRVAQGENPEDIFGPYAVQFNYAWWQVNVTADDKLRQKVAYALSQILVTSANSDLGDHEEALSYYYDLLVQHAFGNYRDLLSDVTYSVPMGYYLSHMNNPKAVPEENIRPDENYAREIMQLFTIGLYELNNDGTRKLDPNGDPIPTYGQDEIKEFAEVFTGLGASGIEDYVWWTDEPFFGLDLWATQKDTSLRMYQAFHDESEKVLLDGYVIPAGQTGDQDISDAIDHLFEHPNVGPFVSSRLIQRLVKSNPTPGYVNRVANAFNDNGQGVRGDMKAVIKAILLDEEARSGEAMLTPEAGKFKEPILRMANIGMGIGLSNTQNRYWENGVQSYNAFGQHPMNSPTVFNFYAPDFQPNGDIQAAELVAPEFKLHNTSKAVTSINRGFEWSFWGTWGYSWEGGHLGNGWEDSVIRLESETLFDFAENPEELMTEIDKRLTYGQLSDQTRATIIDAIDDIFWTWDDNWKEERTRMALYLVSLSPDFTTIK